MDSVLPRSTNLVGLPRLLAYTPSLEVERRLSRANQGV